MGNFALSWACKSSPLIFLPYYRVGRCLICMYKYVAWKRPREQFSHLIRTVIDLLPTAADNFGGRGWDAVQRGKLAAFISPGHFTIA